LNQLSRLVAHLPSKHLQSSKRTEVLKEDLTRAIVKEITTIGIVIAVIIRITKDLIINLTINKLRIQNPVAQFQPIVEIECI